MFQNIILKTILFIIHTVSLIAFIQYIIYVTLWVLYDCGHHNLHTWSWIEQQKNIKYLNQKKKTANINKIHTHKKIVDSVVKVQHTYFLSSSQFSRKSHLEMIYYWIPVVLSFFFFLSKIFQCFFLSCSIFSLYNILHSFLLTNLYIPLSRPLMHSSY